MNKFLKIEASTTGTVLIGTDSIGLVSKASNTTVTIVYNAASTSADILTITHTSDATFATVNAIIDAIINVQKPNAAPLQFIAPVLPTGISISAVAIA